MDRTLTPMARSVRRTLNKGTKSRLLQSSNNHDDIILRSFNSSMFSIPTPKTIKIQQQFQFSLRPQTFSTSSQYQDYYTSPQQFIGDPVAGDFQWNCSSSSSSNLMGNTNSTRMGIGNYNDSSRSANQISNAVNAAAGSSSQSSTFSATQIPKSSPMISTKQIQNQIEDHPPKQLSPEKEAAVKTSLFGFHERCTKPKIKREVQNSGGETQVGRSNLSVSGIITSGGSSGSISSGGGGGGGGGGVGNSGGGSSSGASGSGSGSGQNNNNNNNSSSSGSGSSTKKKKKKKQLQDSSSSSAVATSSKRWYSHLKKYFARDRIISKCTTIMLSSWDFLSRYGGMAINKSMQLSWSATKWTGQSIWELVTNPKVVKVWYAQSKESLHHMVSWIKTGFRLFGLNVRISYNLMKRSLMGYPLTLRDRKLLVRTTADIGKIIPFSFFIIIPFAELLLPFAVKLFPNMLPSTFFEKSYNNSQLAQKLRAKQELAKFFREVVDENTKNEILRMDFSDTQGGVIVAGGNNNNNKDGSNYTSSSKSSSSLTPEQISLEFEKFVSKLETKQGYPNAGEVLKFAKLFGVFFNFDNLNYQQQKAMADVLGIDILTSLPGHLSIQLRHHCTRLRREDRDILWEGVESFQHEELIDLCRARAIPFAHVNESEMRMNLRRWLELSSHRSIPISMLLWIQTYHMSGRGAVDKNQVSEVLSKRSESEQQSKSGSSSSSTQSKSSTSLSSSQSTTSSSDSKDGHSTISKNTIKSSISSQTQSHHPTTLDPKVGIDPTSNFELDIQKALDLSCEKAKREEKDRKEMEAQNKFSQQQLDTKQTISEFSQTTDSDSRATGVAADTDSTKSKLFTDEKLKSAGPTFDGMNLAELNKKIDASDASGIKSDSDSDSINLTADSQTKKVSESDTDTDTTKQVPTSQQTVTDDEKADSESDITKEKLLEDFEAHAEDKLKELSQELDEIKRTNKELQNERKRAKGIVVEEDDEEEEEEGNEDEEEEEEEDELENQQGGVKVGETKRKPGTATSPVLIRMKSMEKKTGLKTSDSDSNTTVRKGNNVDSNMNLRSESDSTTMSTSSTSSSSSSSTSESVNNIGSGAIPLNELLKEIQNGVASGEIKPGPGSKLRRQTTAQILQDNEDKKLRQEESSDLHPKPLFISSEDEIMHGTYNRKVTRQEIVNVLKSQESEISHLRDVISKQGELLSYQLTVLTTMRENARQSTLMSQKESKDDELELLKRTLFDNNIRLQESLTSFTNGLQEVEEQYEQFNAEDNDSDQCLDLGDDDSVVSGENRRNGGVLHTSELLRLLEGESVVEGGKDKKDVERKK